MELLQFLQSGGIDIVKVIRQKLPQSFGKAFQCQNAKNHLRRSTCDISLVLSQGHAAQSLLMMSISCRFLSSHIKNPIHHPDTYGFAR